MDTIKKMPNAEPFSVNYAYDSNLKKDIVFIGEGRILIDGAVIPVPGIMFSDRSAGGSGYGTHVYLVADEDMQNPRLTLDRESEDFAFCKKILTLENGSITRRDVTSLCVGCPEFKMKVDKDGNSTRAISKEVKAMQPQPRGLSRHCACKDKGVDIEGMFQKALDLLGKYKNKINQIRQLTR